MSDDNTGSWRKGQPEYKITVGGVMPEVKKLAEKLKTEFYGQPGGSFRPCYRCGELGEGDWEALARVAEKHFEEREREIKKEVYDND